MQPYDMLTSRNVVTMRSGEHHSKFDLRPPFSCKHNYFNTFGR